MSFLKLGQRKGPPRVPEAVKKQAKRLFMLGSMTNEAIAKECGIHSRTLRKIKAEEGWDKQLAERKTQIDQAVSSPVEGLVQEEAELRQKHYHLADLVLLQLHSQFVDEAETKKHGKIVLTELGMRDLKLGIDALEKAQKIQFAALGISADDSVPKSELQKVTDLFALIVNEEVVDLTTRKRIAKRLRLADDKSGGTKDD